MLISHSKEFIYTKTFKTASTSIEVYFEPYCVDTSCWNYSHFRPEYESEFGVVGFRGKSKEIQEKNIKWYNHMSAKEIFENIGQAIWEKYFKFCTIRNPFDKTVSAFHFYLWKNSIQLNKEASIQLFRERIKSGKGIIIDRDKYLINEYICVDYFIKYESLLNDLKYVCKILRLPFKPERVKSIHSNLRPLGIPTKSYYDADTEEIIRNAYDFEIRYFNYELEKNISFEK